MYFSPRYPGFVFDFGGQAGVKCVELPLRTPGMLPTAAELDRFLEEQTKAGVAVRMCVLCHPDNPTGYVWTRAECLRLVAWCRQNEVLLVSDEIYAKSPQWAAATTTPTREDRRDSTVVLVIDDPAPGAPSSGSTAKSGSVVPERFQSLWRYADVTLWGLSKDIGLAGLRCGVMYSPHASLFRKARTYAEPMQLPAIYQTVLAEVLADKGFIDKYLADLCQELQLARQAVRKKLVDELRLSIDLPEVGKRADGGVFVWVDFSEFGIPSADLFSILLEEYRVFLAPGHSFFDAPALGDACYHLRLCFAGCSPDTLAVGLERVARFVRDARDGKFAPRTPSTTGSIE
ncbi:unnamed protein product [Amoebophrya sp. A120]|nr:unnamed protein product [Amoebophrya sp. A120]|eukprot:GSA120T00003476001.1